MNLHGEFNFKFVGEFLHEEVKVARLLAVVEADRFCQLFNQLRLQIVLDPNVVQGCHLFLKLCQGRIIIRDYRGEGACPEREGYDSDDHKEDAHDLFSNVDWPNIAITDGQNGSYCEIHRVDEELKIFQVRVAPLVDPVVFLFIIKSTHEDPKHFT